MATCGSTTPGPILGCSWTCSEQRKHTGRHKSRDLNNTVVHTWAKATTKETIR